MSQKATIANIVQSSLLDPPPTSPAPPTPREEPEPSSLAETLTLYFGGRYYGE